MTKEEKKVEFIELIYDLIFVYLIGRNGAILHQIEGGFFSVSTYLTFALYTLAVIQIWNFSTFYINRYGRNGLRDHIFVLINMYLLYFMAQGTQADWQALFNRYFSAWALILINIGIQYLIELRNHKDAPWEGAQIKRSAWILLIEALIVAFAIIAFNSWHINLAPAAILFGIIAAVLSEPVNRLVPIDFPHLSERAMLYVVFTFGEMIIALTVYFIGDFSFGTIYFSLMAFLIVAGLFLNYETLYNHVIDREKITSGIGYMLIHVFLIFALNNITAALEFMQEEEVSLVPKILFLTGSVILYFLCLFLTDFYAKRRLRFSPRFILFLIAVALSFAALMFLFRGNMYINIAITVVYVYGIFIMMYFYGKSESKSRA